MPCVPPPAVPLAVALDGPRRAAAVQGKAETRQLKSAQTDFWELYHFLEAKGHTDLASAARTLFIADLRNVAHVESIVARLQIAVNKCG